jgi:DNA-binding transcriptional MerR regulator
MPARVDGRLTIGQAAQAAGTTASVLRSWSDRYGWPDPPRTAARYRLFSPREVAEIRWVREQHAAGRALGEILAQGRPTMPAQPIAPIPTTDLDFSALPTPRTADADALRVCLIQALTQRNPGCIRYALAQRPRLHPFDRDAAVDGILRLAWPQLGRPAWLAPLLEADHVF